jgi:hypothetical protein
LGVLEICSLLERVSDLAASRTVARVQLLSLLFLTGRKKIQRQRGEDFEVGKKTEKTFARE